MPSPAPVYVNLIMSRAVTGPDAGQENFGYGLFDQTGAEIYSAQSSTNGRIFFSDIQFTNPGEFYYTIKETYTPQVWQSDTRVWPVHFHVSTHLESGAQVLTATVTYPEGVPVFSNEYIESTYGKIEFADLTFSAPGRYEYFMREETPSGGGWTIDDKLVRVIVIVEDDEHGNLIATVEYPDGYPCFTNTYAAVVVRVKITGCTLAIGSPLPPGKFTFGLFDENGKLVATATNGPADEKIS